MGNQKIKSIFQEQQKMVFAWLNIPGMNILYYSVHILLTFCPRVTSALILFLQICHFQKAASMLFLYRFIMIYPPEYVWQTDAYLYGSELSYFCIIPQRLKTLVDTGHSLTLEFDFLILDDC